MHWVRVAVSGSGLCIDERDDAGETSLILAAERGDAVDVRLLLDAGADPRAMSVSGWTALQGVVECDCVRAIEILVDAGADISAMAWSGKTPLDIVIQYTNPEAVELLLALGASSGLTGSVA